MNGELWKVPQSWIWSKLDVAADWSSGGTPKSTEPKYYDGDIPWLIIGDLNDGLVIDSTKRITRLGMENSSAKLVKKGSILIAMYGSIGKLGIAGIDCTTNQAIAFTQRISPELDPKFLFYYLLYTRKQLNEVGKGGTQQNISQTVLKDFPICIASFTEQRCIVAKLEALLGKVDACQKRLEKIPRILKRFRQSVLAAACDGKLTADWRERNPNVESAIKLIKEVRFKLQAQLDELPELPEKWVWAALGNYGQCLRGRFSHRPRNEPRFFGGKYPFIQIGNLPSDGGWITSHTQTLNDEGLAISKMFPKGTVAIAIVGATIGNTGILSYDMCFTDSMVGIETGNEFSNKYIELFLRYKKDDIRQASYAGGGQPNIKLETLNPYPIALPPLVEQQEIVRRVESLFKLADQLEARYQKAKAYVDKLTQSILAKAFRGELVPQDPNDEPASVLLERIQKEKSQAEAATKTRKPNTKAKQVTEKELVVTENQMPFNEKIIEVLEEKISRSLNNTAIEVEKLGAQLSLPFMNMEE
ncbi:MAG: restriction endonuclease subunit S [Acidobacteria bacterium]|nr:restriction endonuclease subunit S [Acidobacteriota bacterium]